MKPFLLASASTLALLAAPAVARASCPQMSLNNQTYTNATAVCFFHTSGDVGLTNTNTGMIGSVWDTAPTDTTTIDNAGLISGYSGYAAIQSQGALTLTNRSGAIISASGVVTIRAGNRGGVTTIVNDGRIEGNKAIDLSGSVLDLTNTGIIAGQSAGIDAYSVTATNSGTISGGSFALRAIGDLTLDNSGDIVANTNPSPNTAAVKAWGGATAITNSGRIWSDSGYGVYAEVYVKNTPVGSFNLTNTGTIGGNIGVATASNSVSTVSATIVNSGTISGYSAAISTDGDLTLDNSGWIKSIGDSGDWHGVAAHGVTTKITNSGTIDNSGVYGTGIVADSTDANASLTLANSGAINATFGVSSQVVTTTIDNSGSITSTGGAGVYANGPAANASLTLTNRSGGRITGEYGVDSLLATTTIDNSGTITGVYDAAVYAEDTAAGTSLALVNRGTITGRGGVSSRVATTKIDNSGIIDVVPKGGAGVFAFGTLADASLALTNSGTIDGIYGVHSQVTTTTIDNSGTIAGKYLAGYGIYADSTATNASLALTNSGKITGRFGVYSQVATTTIDNSGFIDGDNGQGVYAQNTAANASLALTNSGWIFGYYGVLSLNATTTIDNSGEIAGRIGAGVSAQSRVADAALALTNSGTISGSVSGVSSQVATTTIDNSGTIAGRQYGIYADSLLTLTNTGLISGGTAAVLLNKDGNSLGLDKGARFDGVIDYAGTTGNTTRFGHGSWILDVANYDAADNTIVTGGSAYVVKGNQIIVADGSAVQAGARGALDITRSLSGLASDALSLSSSSLPVASSSGGALAYAGDNAVDRAFTSAALTGSGQENAFSGFSNGAVGDAAGNIVWSRVLAGRSVASQDAASAASRMNFVGAAFGGDHRFSDTLRLGGFFGLADSRTDTDGDSSLKSKWYYAGLYGSWSPGAAFVEGNVTGGYAKNRSERMVTNGLATETAIGEYGSTFVSPELALGYRVALQPGVSLTPQLRVRYLGVDAEGYGETGSSSDMAVSSHYTGFLEERALTKLQFDNERWGLFTTLGVVALQRVQGSGTDVNLLGIASTVPEGDTNLFGVSFGLGGNWKMTDSVSLYGAVNGTALNNNTSIDTNVGVKMVF
ncbi:autotransporter outer membrane beta-barrel domain-containing protein [Mesorhizobium sp. 113-1-2]|uniref:autotransporter outer membrane beta-barrel domain-containing protein n=1 Tax=Mesorhizobium sp. 113-1-2 TaxID=2744515 RepID=UPI0019289993|nr:autotransporter outer membrane beta-barrel domain-containing protein [Mesorhizobium sp. 113-1-2]